MSTTSSVRRSSPNVQRFKAFQRAKRRRKQRIIAAALAMILILAAALLLLNRGEDNVPTFEIVHSPYSDIPVSGRTLGDSTAPVKVIEYGDYQCPGCGYFAREIEQQLVQDYVATGKIRFEFRDYAFIGDESTAAAEAAACAQDQDAFWQYHATLFHSQLGENAGGFGSRRLGAMARGLGLNEEQFNSCIDDRVHVDEVDEMRAEARALGVTGTPSFVVNGTLIEYSGYESLSAAIEAALAKKQS
jgi:protein-disulfide isomerase